jgi:type I restriction enzyme S subunit
MSVRSKPNREREASAEPEREGSDFPEGWASVALKDLTVPFRPRRNPREFSSLRYVGMEQIESHTRRLLGTSDASQMKSTAFHFQPNDVLYGRLRPYLNKVWRAEFEGLCSSEFIVLPPTGAFEPTYLSCFLSTDEFVEFANHLNQGDRPRVSFDQIGGFQIPIPPLAEQRRIVVKLELLLGKVSSSQQRLSRVPGLLKRFRQSVLAAACSGRLTADWREENETNDTGRELLSQIKAARLKLASTAKEEGQIEAAFDSSVPEVTEVELGFDSLPETWTSCRIGTVGSVCNGSTPSRQQLSFWEGEIPWVSSGEVRNNLITFTRERITKAGFDGTSVRLLPRGTVLLAMIGEGKTRGQSAILEIEATINQNIAAVVISHGMLDPTFLWRWFQMRYEATREQGSGSGPQALNCQRVRELPFVLPPLAEQHEIVRRVEKLLAFADQIEARLKHAQAHVGRLTQSLLAKAFRGELVPTEAELARREGRRYESASELLERIRATRVGETLVKQPRRRLPKTIDRKPSMGKNRCRFTK